MLSYLKTASRLAGFMCLVALLPISSLSEEDVSDQFVLVWNGNSMVRRAIWTLKGIHVEWEYWLYKKGAPQIEKYHWGTESANTLPELKRRLRTDQDFEKRWEHMCGCPWGDFTNFNVKGPIASIKGVPPAIENAAKEMREKANEVHELMEAYNQAKEMADSIEIRGRATPFSVTEEFRNLLKEAQERVKRVKDVLDKATKLSEMMNGLLYEREDTIYHQLELVKRDLQNTKESAQRLGLYSGFYARTTLSAPIGAQEVEINGGRITQTLSSSADTVRVVQKTDDAGHGQTYVVPKDDLQGAKPALRQQGTAWVVTVVLPRRSAQLQISNGPGNDDNEVVSRIELFFNNEADARRGARQLTGIDP